MRQLRQKHDKAPRILAEAEEQLKQMEDSRRILRDLAPVWDDITRLQSHEIPGLEQTCRATERERNTGVSRLDKVCYPMLAVVRATLAYPSL